MFSCGGKASEWSRNMSNELNEAAHGIVWIDVEVAGVTSSNGD